MKKGIYEKVINRELDTDIQARSINHEIHCDELKDNTNNVLTAYTSSILSNALNHYSGDVDKQIILVNRLIKEIGSNIEDNEYSRNEIVDKRVLKAILDKHHNSSKDINNIYPLTSISTSTLFTGGSNEPTVFSELIREIKTADRVDLLVSFIKFSGLRLLLEAFKELTINRDKKLRVITTSYMSASDFKAIKVLSELPNTEIKISYDTERTRLHAKAYYFHGETGFSTAYIGSSNMSKAALTEGTEWNLKLSQYTSPDIITKYCVTFDTYWNSTEFQIFDPNNIGDVSKLKRSLAKENETNGISPLFDIRPYAYQQEILDKLEVEREIHNSRRNLVVAATGTGKTVISAFDFKRYYKENRRCRLLFLAHRKEILEQSRHTFQGILKDQNFGELWVGEYKPANSNHLFASVQTLNSNENYKEFAKDYFDYIVLDETHHGKASSYERLLNYFTPDILLGLTATPERMDGLDILEHFNNRIAYEIRLQEAIDRKLLSPFHYFGITDSQDLTDITWQRGKYSASELTNVYTGNDMRAQLIMDKVKEYTTDMYEVKGLGFCVSKEHAQFMSKVFDGSGISSMHLDSDSNIEDRRRAKKRLNSGEIKFIFVVNIYNEGVDIPEINTVLFLRPTESATIFIQQLGRGLRISEDKEVLTVLDFVGQANKEYNYSTKFRGMLGRTNNPIRKEVLNDFPSLPKGCHIHLEEKAKKYVLDNLIFYTANKKTLQRLLRNYRLEAHKELNLANYIEHYDIELYQIYKTSTFYKLCDELGLIEDYRADNYDDVKTAFKRLMFMDSGLAIDILLKLLGKEHISIKELSNLEKTILLMYYYTMFADAPKGDLEGCINDFMMGNPIIIKESIELLMYNRNRIMYLEKMINLGFECPLELHARYTTDQILVAMGEHTDEKKKSFREGVLYCEEHKTDLLFITLNKSTNQYSPTTQYEDYAISNTLFHWQTQNKTSDTSKVGIHYINQRQSKHNVLLFVRENKLENGMTSPYYFLGKANYVSHKGNKPINIIWELEEPMPIALLKKSNRMSDIV